MSAELSWTHGSVGEGLGSVWPPDHVPEKGKEPEKQSCSQERLPSREGRDDQPAIARQSASEQAERSLPSPLGPAVSFPGLLAANETDGDHFPAS